VQVDLERLGFDEGGHLLVKPALRRGSVGEEIRVTGSAPELESHLRAWCRSEGHSFRWLPDSLPDSQLLSLAVVRKPRGGPAPSVLAGQALLNLKQW